MPIACRAEVVVARPVAEVFECAAARTEGLARYFSGNAPLVPAIAHARLLDATDPPRAGVLREVKLGDGSRFADEGGRTRVTWDYTIFQQGVLGALVGKLVARSFERAMQRCLDNLARDLA
jgi:uncharacterized protein YndB with AHSA1/START domain